MNLTAVLLALLAAGAMLFGAERVGEARGAALRATADQARFDATASALDKQKSQAAALLQQHAADVIAQQAADARANQLQEQLHVSDAQHTDDARRLLAAGRLRLTIPAADAGRGCGGGGAVQAGADAAGAPRTETVDVPAPAARDLRELVHDADVLADAYRECYRFAYPGWRDPVNDPAPLAPPAADPAASTPERGTP